MTRRLATRRITFIRVLRFPVEQGKSEGWISKKRNAFETVALIIGATNQINFTRLLYQAAQPHQERS